MEVEPYRIDFDELLARSHDHAATAELIRSVLDDLAN
jgi:hypothetical protein